MADINPDNIVGAANTLVGYVGGVDYPPYDKNGERGYKQVSIAINEGYKKNGEFVKTGTTWYRYEAHQDRIAELGIEKGDKLRIDGAKQEVKEYESGGEKRLGITLSYGAVTILEKGTPRQAAPAQGSEGGDYF
jgi:hypothetical protein